MAMRHFIVNITDIDWDTSDWDCELAEGPHSANVPDLPSSIEEVGLYLDEDADLDEAIEEYLSKVYDFCVNNYAFEVVGVEDA